MNASNVIVRYSKSFRIIYSPLPLIKNFISALFGTFTYHCFVTFLIEVSEFLKIYGLDLFVLHQYIFLMYFVRRLKTNIKLITSFRLILDVLRLQLILFVNIMLMGPLSKQVSALKFYILLPD